MDMHGPGGNRENGLVLLSTSRASNQLQQTFVKTNRRIYVDTPFLQIQFDAGQAQLAKSLPHLWREFWDRLLTPSDTQEEKYSKNKFKPHGHVMLLLGRMIKDHCDNYDYL